MTKDLNCDGVGEIETHPWPPFIPDGARILVLGTFPPQPKRWSIDFYYPNRTNDFWPAMALIFLGDKGALYGSDGRTYDVDAIKALLCRHGIALHDTGRKVRRLMGNASDKFLEIVEPVPLDELLSQMPQCRTIAATGEKAASVVASLIGTEVPRMGECVVAPSGITLWRMPSTSRAYPLSVERKAECYAEMFRRTGIL